MIFGKKHDFLPKKFFLAKHVLLCSKSVELKTDSRSALWLGFTTELNVVQWKFALSGPYQILTSIS